MTEAYPARRRTAWLIVAGAFVAYGVSAGSMHAYAVFLLAFLETFGWSRAETSVAYAVSQFVAGASSPVTGALSDRLGTRRMLLIGGTLLVAGLAGSAFASAQWHFILLYGVVMTMGANCLGLIVFVPLLSRLFPQQRGLAISVAQSANGFGRAASAPAAQYAIDAIGWRPSYLLNAALAAIVLLPLALLFRGGAAGGKPATAPPPAAAAPAAPAPDRGWTLGEAIRTPHFWLLVTVYFCTGLGSFLVSLHQLAFAVDAGFEPLYAAQVLGMGAFLAIPGIIAAGTVSDYIGRELSAILTYIVSIIGVLAALAIDGPGQHVLLWVHACCFGLTWGARGPAITAKTADLFPGPRLGTILGVITIGTGIGSAFGSWAAGYVFDMTGSYRYAFMLSIAAYAGGCVAFWALRRPPMRRSGT